MSVSPKIKVVAIVGPTASGKTSLSIYLAQKIGREPRTGASHPRGEVVSADSRQVYRGLDIGTGKVTRAEMAGIPHHLLDVVPPSKVYNASDFEKAAHKAIELISSKHHVPIVVGGTGFYIDTLLGRMLFPDVPPNEKLRARLDKKSVIQLHSMLEQLDPDRAKTVERHNKRRLIRALEIAAALGKSPKGGPALEGEGAYDVLWLGIRPTDEQLRHNIRTRLLERIGGGMVVEAQALHASGLSYKRMEGLGLEYRYLSYLLQGTLSKEQFVSELNTAIEQYAKRQIRWFKRNKDIHWLEHPPGTAKGRNEAVRLAKAFLHKHKK